MPEKNSSVGTLNLNMELCFNSEKKIHVMTMKMHGFRVSPPPPPPPLGSKILKISLGLSKVS